MSAATQFKSVVHGANPITPAIIRYGEVAGRGEAAGHSYAYELSSGFGFNGQELFGVTVVMLGGYGGRDTHDFDKSRVFDSRMEAEAYITGGLRG